MTETISIIAGLFNVLAGSSYLKQVVKNESTPNPTTWIIWLVVTVINSATYFSVVGNKWIALSSAITAIMVFLIFVLSLFKGKFTKLSKIDVVSLALAVVIGIFWQISGNAIISNISLQAVFIISFYPTINGLLTGASKENYFAWTMGCCSYILQICNIFLSPVTLIALGFPAIQLIGQGYIAILAYHKSSSK